MEQKQQIPTQTAPQVAPTKVAKTKQNKTIKRAIMGTAVAAIVAVGGWFCYKSMMSVDNSIYEIAKQSIGEARHSTRAAQEGNIKVEFHTGMREENFQKNGIATKAVPFALVNVTADDSLKAFSQIDGMVKIGEDTYDITLLQNPYNPLNFTYDIIKSLGREIKLDEQVTVTLFISSTNHPTIALKDTMTSDCITWDKALQIATGKMEANLKGKKFETYITITHGMAKDSGAFWYVQFVTEDGKSHYVVVAPDGAVVG